LFVAERAVERFQQFVVGCFAPAHAMDLQRELAKAWPRHG
jgi:hypothetical protein